MGYRIGAIVQATLPDGTVYNRRQSATELAALPGANPYMGNPYMTTPQPQYYAAPPLNPYAPYGTPAANPYQYMPTPYGYTDPYSAAYSASYYGGGYSPYGY